MPVFPGQLRYIRKNLFHSVFVLDPASLCGLEASFCSLWLSSIFCASYWSLMSIINLNIADSGHDHFIVREQSPYEVWCNIVLHKISWEDRIKWWWTSSCSSEGWPRRHLYFGKVQTSWCIFIRIWLANSCMVISIIEWPIYESYPALIL